MTAESSKIVFVNRFYFPDISATSQILTDASRFLSDKGHRVEIVTSRLSYEGQDTFSPFEEIGNVRVHRIWTSIFGRKFLLGRAIDYITFYLSVFFKLIWILRSGDTVIAKTDPPMVSVPVSWAASLKKAKLVTWNQDLFPEVAAFLGIKMPVFLYRLLRWMRNQSLHQARTNVAIGERMRKLIVSYGIETSRVVVVPNWSDGDAIKPGTDVSRLKENWGLSGHFTVGYSGNLGRAHEIQTLEEAIEESRDDQTLRYLFVGGGALMDEMKQHCIDKEWPNCVFKPYQPRELLPQSLLVPDVHVVVLKPELEGLIVPSKVYGVLAAGRPTIFIGDTQGEVSQLLREHGVGIVIDIGDSEALLGSINQLREDDKLRQAMSKAARDLFESEFTKEAALLKLEGVLI